MDSNRADLVKMGKHISDLRKGKGFTQKYLGNLLDVSDKTISKWEQGLVAPDITILESLAKTLSVSVEEILHGEKIEDEISDEESVKILSIYSSQTKSGLIKKFAFFFFLIIIIASLLLYVEDFYKWKITKIVIDEDFYISGQIIKNPKESKIVVDKIAYKTDDSSNENNSIKIKKIEIKISDGNNISIQKNILFDEPIYLYEAFQNVVLFFEQKGDVSINDLNIKIKYLDVNNIENYFFYNIY